MRSAEPINTGVCVRVCKSMGVGVIFGVRVRSGCLCTLRLRLCYRGQAMVTVAHFEELFVCHPLV